MRKICLCIMHKPLKIITYIGFKGTEKLEIDSNPSLSIGLCSKSALSEKSALTIV